MRRRRWSSRATASPGSRASAGAGANFAVIPHGFDAGFASATGSQRDPKRIVMVSRLFARKGAQHLLRAIAGLDRECELHVVGSGPYLATLRRLAQSLGVHVHFHGWLDNRSDELRRLLETSAIFVLPSESENFPVVLQEAMAAGLPIITVEGTGSEEVVGDAGLMVPPRDVEALRNALRRLLDEPTLRQALGATARARLEDKVHVAHRRPGVSGPLSAMRGVSFSRESVLGAILTVAAVVIIVLLLGEAVLQLSRLSSSRTKRPACTCRTPKLGHVMRPGYDGWMAAPSSARA